MKQSMSYQNKKTGQIEAFPMILRKEEKTEQNRKKKIPIKSAKVRVHLLPQCHLTGHPEEKAGKQEQHGWGTLARPCLAQSSLDEFTNRADQGRHALVVHSHSSPVLTHQAPARVVLPIFKIKNSVRLL